MFTNFFTRKQLIKTLILSSIGVLIETIYIVINITMALGMDYSLAGLIAGTLFLLIGWMSANHISNEYRRSTKNYGGALPLEIVNKKMTMRSPYIVSALFAIAFSVVSQLVSIII